MHPVEHDLGGPVPAGRHIPGNIGYIENIDNVDNIDNIDNQ